MTCPHCSSGVSVFDGAGNPWYDCGTTKTFRSSACIERENAMNPLRVEVDRLRAALKDLADAAEPVVADKPATTRDYVELYDARKRALRALEGKP